MNNYNFDEDEDIILPCTLWDEIRLVYIVLYYILKSGNKAYRERQFDLLQRQMYFWLITRDIDLE